MGFLANPVVLKGASMFGGWLAGKMGQKSAMKRSPEEQAALTGGQGAANQLLGQGKQLTEMGTGAGTSALNYWQTLLSGNRAAMSQATAGPTAQITDQYRGAERSLERSGVRGGVRDLAKAEMSRDRVGSIAGLTTGVQPMAANQLGDLGSRFAQLGTASSATSGNIWANLLGSGFENRKYGREEGGKLGGSIGSLLFDVLSGSFGKKKGGIEGSPPQAGLSFMPGTPLTGF